MTEIVEKQGTNAWDILGKILPFAAISVLAYLAYRWIAGSSSPIFTNGGTPTNGTGGGYLSPGATGLYSRSASGPGGVVNYLTSKGSGVASFMAVPSMTSRGYFDFEGNRREPTRSEVSFLSGGAIGGYVGNDWLTSKGLPNMAASQGSVSRYAIWTGQAGTTAAGNVLGMVSGRDTQLVGQTAVFNTRTGNTWGGQNNAMAYLYNSQDPTAAAWRARFG